MNFLHDLLNVIFPNLCCGCSRSLGRNEEHICFSCRSSLPKTGFTDLLNNELIRRFYGRLEVAYAISLLYFYKSGITQRLLHQLKYRNYPEIGEMLGNWLGHNLNDLLPGNIRTDLIVPVPLHPKKERKRGYNQSCHIAKGISEITKIPVDTHALERIIYEDSQTKKTREQRWKSVEQAFRVSKPESIVNKHILLVDDIVTTGATIEACAKQMLENGCSEISIASIAMAK